MNLVFLIQLFTNVEILNICFSKIRDFLNFNVVGNSKQTSGKETIQKQKEDNSAKIEGWHFYKNLSY